MLERPGPDVLAKRGVEPFGPEHFIPQRLQHQRWLLVAGPEQVVHLGGIADQRLLARTGVCWREVQWMHFDRVAVRSPGKIQRSVVQVDEGVESLVHPGIEPLVGPDDHRKPLVAEFVRQGPLLVFPRGGVRHEGQHRVFHPLNRPFHRGGMRVRIRIPLLAEVLDGRPGHAVCLRPLVGRRAIERLDQRAVIPAGVPAHRRPRRERHVAHGIGGEMPGECPRCARPRGGRVRCLARRDNGDRGVGTASDGEAGALGRCQH